MNFFKKLLEYFFSFKIGLSQKGFIYHYFLDLLIYFILILTFWIPGYGLMLSPVADFKIFGMNIVLILNSSGAVFCILFLIVNRFSILVRRLKFLKMNVYYCLLIFIPLVGFILDFYLMTVPDDIEQE